MTNDELQPAAERFLALLQPIEGDLEVYCRRWLREPGDVADALQNAVLRAFRAFDRYHDDAGFRAWMFKILTNEIFRLNRTRSRIARFEVAMAGEDLEQFPGAECAAEDTELEASWERLAEALDQDIVVAVESLNDTERAVLLLKSVGGLRYREIAEALEIPMGSVMGNLSRARRKMRAAILRARRRAAS